MAIAWKKRKKGPIRRLWLTLFHCPCCSHKLPQFLLESSTTVYHNKHSPTKQWKR